MNKHLRSFRVGRASSIRKSFSIMLSALIVFALVAVPLPAASQIPQSSQTSDTSIGPEAAQQISALLKEKASRDHVQQKIDSNLLYHAKSVRGELLAAGVDSLETGITEDDNGSVSVDITARVTEQLLDQLRSMDVEITSEMAAYRSITAQVPAGEIENVAALEDVIFIQPHFGANVWQTGVQRSSDLPANFWKSGFNSGVFEWATAYEVQNARRKRVYEYLSTMSPDSPQVGSRMSQGDATHQTNTVRTTIGSNGTNIKIGVISDGVANLAASQASGDLPLNVTVLPGQTGTGDEGTAMLEIVHDVVPGAQLYFATANPTPARFAQNIRDLRTAGCDIIIDDVFFFVETPFQDGQSPSIVSTTNGGIVTQAVNDVTAGGALYFSSAGNQGNQDDGTSSTYQADWADGGTIGIVPGGNVHNFGGAQYNLIQTGSANQINLYWADALGASANDYDLFVLNSTGTAVLASSTNIQSGTQDPFEFVSGAVNTTNNRVVVVKKPTAAARFFHLTINANGAGKLGTSTEGTTKGHSAALNAFSVGATPAQFPGPYPAAFGGSNSSETFSSDGPRRIFFSANGTPFTPGNASSTGGTLRQKPDITAADGVSVTGAGGFPSTFYGTSAAAPHAGAIAAIIKSAVPGITMAQMRTALTSTAIDIEAVGTDRNTGAGIIMPMPALASLGISGGMAIVSRGTTTTAERSGASDGDGRLEPNEQATVLVETLQNIGVAAATNVTLSLSTTTTGVQIVSPASIPFSDMAPGAISSTNSTPFIVKLGSGFVCGTTINFRLTANFTGGTTGSHVMDLAAPTANTVSVASTTLDAAPPVANPSYTASTGTQVNRLFRDGTASNCGGQKTLLGLSAATNPRYDAYTFTAANTGCATVTVANSSGAANYVFAAAYIGAFNPAVVSANYVADSGSSPESGIPLTFGFNVTAGQQYTIVISEVVGGSAPSYSFSLSGAPCTSCNFAPTAASVAITGRVTEPNGMGIRGAVVSASRADGTSRIAVTNSFGYYTLDRIEAGSAYVVGVTSKRQTFSPRAIVVNDELTNIDFIAGQ